MIAASYLPLQPIFLHKALRRVLFVATCFAIGHKKNTLQTEFLSLVLLQREKSSVQSVENNNNKQQIMLKVKREEANKTYKKQCDKFEHAHLHMTAVAISLAFCDFKKKQLRDCTGI